MRHSQLSYSELNKSPNDVNVHFIIYSTARLWIKLWCKYTKVNSSILYRFSPDTGGFFHWGKPRAWLWADSSTAS